MRLRTFIYSLFAILFMSGCTPEEQNMILGTLGTLGGVGTTNSGINGTAYNQGTNDGCWSKQNNQLRRDANAYRYNADYKRGWDYGYNQCQTNTNNSTAYNQGANDGCWSKQSNQLRRDANAYRYNADYKRGWDYGYNGCTREY